MQVANSTGRCTTVPQSEVCGACVGKRGHNLFCCLLAEIFENHALIRWIGHMALDHHPERRRWTATDCMSRWAS